MLMFGKGDKDNPPHEEEYFYIEVPGEQKGQEFLEGACLSLFFNCCVFYIIGSESGEKGGVTMRTAGKRKKARETIQGYLFVAPLFLFFLVFTAIPVIVTLFYLGFTKYNIMNNPKWIGIANFKRIFQDPSIPQVAWNVIRLPMFLVPAHVVCSLLLAYGVYRIKNRYFKYVCRTAIYFPAITTTASVSIAWGYLFNKDLGVFNWVLEKLGIISEGIPWLTSSNYAMTAIVIFSIWKFSGLHFLYYLIGFENIPVSYYEAARMDGAGEWTLFRKIVLPLLTPSIFYVLLTTMIGTMQAFDEPYFLTHGGPGDNTRTVAMFIYEKAFQSYDMGYASAVAALLFLAVFTLTALQLYWQKGWVNYDYE